MPCRYVYDPDSGLPYSLNLADDLPDDQAVISASIAVDPPGELDFTDPPVTSNTEVFLEPSGGVASKRYRVTVSVNRSDGPQDYTLIFDCRQT